MLAWLMFPSPINAQDFICGTTLEEEESFQKVVTQPQSVAGCSQTTTKGLYLPSMDTIRIRVIFAKFQDDTDTVSYWPQSGFPSGALGFIDSTTSQNSTHNQNLTNFYRTFSNGQFLMIGKVDTVTLNHSMSNTNYQGGSDYFKNTYNANKAVLNQLSSRPGFELFDDWSKSDNNHSKCSDSVPQADFIILIWRSNRFSSSDIGGFAAIGGPQDSSFSINGVLVNTWLSSSGSGVSMIKRGGFGSF